MKRIIGYDIVISKTDRELAAAINHRINLGWEPIGGVFVVPFEKIGDIEYPGYGQAIVLYEG